MSDTRRRSAAYLLLIAGLVGAKGCVEVADVGTLDRASAGASTGGASGTASGTSAGRGGEAGLASGADAGGSAGAAPCQPATCLGKTYACGSCADEDGDGAVDADDPECLGACDNSEDSYFGNIPGANNAPCRQDCYFDGDTGSGNDDCSWSHTCDALSLAPAYPPSGDDRCAYAPDAAVPGAAGTCAELSSEQSSACADFCGPLTPNGCDCFGCCELPAGSGRTVWLGSTRGGQGSCNPDALDDPESCRPCTPVAGCFNTCEPCEDCVGRVGPAPECGGGAAQCAAGFSPCGRPGQAACTAGTYCVTGCCVAVPR